MRSDPKQVLENHCKDDNFLDFITSQDERIDKIYKKLFGIEDISNQWELDLE